MGYHAIRPVALCVFEQAGRIFVAEYTDPVDGRLFYRPLGGTIEYGEYSREAAAREILEETGAAVTNLHYLATIENIFTYRGETGHEIVMVYTAEFANLDMYELPALDCWEADGKAIHAIWKDLGDFLGADAPPLYPTGLLELLVNHETRREKCAEDLH